jgi:Ni,Fe-hydrogenase III component G
MISTDDRLQQAEALLHAWATEPVRPEDNRLDVWIAAADLVAAVEALHGAGWGYLSAITGLDDGPAADGREADGLQALYHFCGGAAVVTLRVRLPYEQPSVPSVCGVIPSASFFERELAEMFGVTVEGTPNPDRLFLPDDWPDGVYPLRKNFDLSTMTPEAGGAA